MKRLFFASALGLALFAGGCSTFQNIGTGISLVTASVSNPVTPTREAQIEGVVDTAIAALNGYRAACIQGTADKQCRNNIVAIQKYTRQMPVLVGQLRMFVDNNDQLNATVVYNQLLNLYATFKTTAANLGYNVGTLP